MNIDAIMNVIELVGMYLVLAVGALCVGWAITTLGNKDR